jgi:hypothetical protein
MTDKRLTKRLEQLEQALFGENWKTSSLKEKKNQKIFLTIP